MTQKEKPCAISDRIFIRLEAPQKSLSGLILTNNPERTMGIVESVGPLVTAVQPGDKVLFHVFDELPTYDPDVVVIRQNSLLGRFEPIQKKKF